MAENCRADRARKEAHRIDRECLEHADQRLRRGKEQLAENQSSNDAVEEKIVPFDGGTDCAGDERPPQIVATLYALGNEITHRSPDLCLCAVATAAHSRFIV